MSFMKRIFSPTVNTTGLHLWLLISRVAVTALMLMHGLPKLHNLMADNVQFADPFGLGPTTSLVLVIFAEVFCSVMIMLGLAARLASVPLIINMSVAILYAHASQPLAKKELAILFLIFFICFAILGAGKFSIDGFIGRKKKSRY